jgi:imidazolonepropionase-like amidohydrolase
MAADSAGSMPNIHQELALLVRAGLTPMEAIVAATQTNAAFVVRQGRILERQ